MLTYVFVDDGDTRAKTESTHDTLHASRIKHAHSLERRFFVDVTKFIPGHTRWFARKVGILITGIMKYTVESAVINGGLFHRD